MILPFHLWRQGEQPGTMYLYCPIQGEVAEKKEAATVAMNTNDTIVLFYAKQWTPPTEAKAMLTFVHGLGEHILRYDAFFTFLSQKCAIHVFAYDQRGFGRTVFLNNTATALPNIPGKVAGMTLGDGGGWVSSMHDIYRACLFHSRVLVNSKIPHTLMGHSMGGLLVTGFACEYLSHEEIGRELGEISSVVASAPGFKPAFPIPWLKRTVGALLAGVLGTVNTSTDLDVTGISRDQAVLDAYKTDPHVHGMISLRSANDMLSKGEWFLEEGYKKFPPALPYLVTFGSKDRITLFSGGKEFAGHVPKAEFKEFPGLYHELHNEPEKQEIWEFYSEWILKRAQVLFLSSKQQL